MEVKVQYCACTRRACREGRLVEDAATMVGCAAAAPALDGDGIARREDGARQIRQRGR